MLYSSAVFSGNLNSVPAVTLAKLLTFRQRVPSGDMSKDRFISAEAAHSRALLRKGRLPRRKTARKSICSSINWPKSCREAGRPADLCQKAYQEGGRLIRDRGIRVESLARVASMSDDGSIEFC